MPRSIRRSAFCLAAPARHQESRISNLAHAPPPPPRGPPLHAQRLAKFDTHLRSVIRHARKLKFPMVETVLFLVNLMDGGMAALGRAVKRTHATKWENSFHLKTLQDFPVFAFSELPLAATPPPL